MKASAHCKALIAQFESYGKALPDGRCTAYPDPASAMGSGKYPIDGPDISKGAPWTIGFGATGPDITRGTVWTLAQAESDIDARISRIGNAVTTMLGPWPATQNQFDALVSLAYNIGTGALAHSTLLAKHNVGDYEGAAKEFARWNKAGGRVLAGLTKRRAAEAALYASA